MTREDIIRWAREVEDYADTIYEKGEYHPGWLEVRDQRFAALVAAAQREECAQVCEAIAWSDEAKFFAKAIRERGDNAS